MRDCVDSDFHSLSFLKLFCRTLRKLSHEKQHIRKTNSGCSSAYYFHWNMTEALLEKYHLFDTNLLALSVCPQLLTVQLTLSHYQLHPPSIL